MKRKQKALSVKTELASPDWRSNAFPLGHGQDMTTSELDSQTSSFDSHLINPNLDCLIH
jgi:hypothetical protein